MDPDLIYTIGMGILGLPFALIITWGVIMIFVVNPIMYLAGGHVEENCILPENLEPENSKPAPKSKEPDDSRVFKEYPPEYEISDPFDG